MNDEEKTHLRCLEDALSSTYKQSFESTTGLIAAAIRNGELRLALQMYDALKVTCGNYLSQLSAARKRALDTLDLDAARRAEERIQEFHQSGGTDFEGCVIESLESFTDLMITSFERAREDIEDRYDLEEDATRNDLDKKFGKIELDLHVPALVTLEKQYAIAKKKEEKRAMAAFRDKELGIRAMVTANDFQGAEREKEKLDRDREKARADRIRLLKENFDEQRRKLLDRQQKDLKVLEAAFNDQMVSLQAQKERDINAMRATLISTIRTHQQKLLTFTQKLHSKKDWGAEFNKIVGITLTQRNLGDLADTPSKVRRSTRRIKL
jgi:hypothetical protein